MKAAFTKGLVVEASGAAALAAFLTGKVGIKKGKMLNIYKILF